MQGTFCFCFSVYFLWGVIFGLTMKIKASWSVALINWKLLQNHEAKKIFLMFYINVTCSNIRLDKHFFCLIYNFTKAFQFLQIYTQGLIQIGRVKLSCLWMLWWLNNMDAFGSYVSGNTIKMTCLNCSFIRIEPSVRIWYYTAWPFNSLFSLVSGSKKYICYSEI